MVLTEAFAAGHAGRGFRPSPAIATVRLPRARRTAGPRAADRDRAGREACANPRSGTRARVAAMAVHARRERRALQHGRGFAEPARVRLRGRAGGAQAGDGGGRRAAIKIGLRPADGLEPHPGAGGSRRLEPMPGPAAAARFVAPRAARRRGAEPPSVGSYLAVQHIGLQAHRRHARALQPGVGPARPGLECAPRCCCARFSLARES